MVVLLVVKFYRVTLEKCMSQLSLKNLISGYPLLLDKDLRSWLNLKIIIIIFYIEPKMMEFMLMVDDIQRA